MIITIELGRLKITCSDDAREMQADAANTPDEGRNSATAEAPGLRQAATAEDSSSGRPNETTPAPVHSGPASLGGGTESPAAQALESHNEDSPEKIEAITDESGQRRHGGGAGFSKRKAPRAAKADDDAKVLICTERPGQLMSFAEALELAGTKRTALQQHLSPSQQAKGYACGGFHFRRVEPGEAIPRARPNGAINPYVIGGARD